MRKNKLVSRFIHLSTNKVYGDLKRLKLRLNTNHYELINNKKGIDENFQLDFQSPYGCSKGASDQYVIDYKRIFNLDIMLLGRLYIWTLPIWNGRSGMVILDNYAFYFK